jgi:hypothetical protein
MQIFNENIFLFHIFFNASKCLIQANFPSKFFSNINSFPMQGIFQNKKQIILNKSLILSFLNVFMWEP